MRGIFSDFWARASIGHYFLSPLSLVYALGWRAYEATYSFGFKTAAEPHCPVICVGNRRVGGTGKSPLVIHLATILQELGHQVVLGVSGYGSPAAEAAQLAPKGPLDPREWGDEPSMLRRALPDIPMIVGRRRVLAAEICHAEFPDAILLMDDGFQHLPLKKHLNIVIETASANPFCMPVGPYREPISGLRRADLVLPGSFTLRAMPTTLETASGTIVEPQPGTKVDMVCAIGSPWNLIYGLEKVGLLVDGGSIRPDHDPLTGGTIFRGLGRNRPLVVTSKDWVKIQNSPELEGAEVWIADYRLVIEPKDEFKNWLQKRLHEIKAKAD